MDFWALPYPSRRQPVLGDAVVATSQPLAAQAGIEALAAGGNAIDAAVAAAMTLTVVEPTGNGLGSDLVALVWDGDHAQGLNATGRSPAAIDVDRLLARPAMPDHGWDTVTVPGAVSGWVALNQRFGRLELEVLAQPAMRYARDGFAVGPVTAAAWRDAEVSFAGNADFAPFLPGGHAPTPGQRFTFPAQAATLQAIADSTGEAFYRGAIAEQIAAHAAAGGGALTADDLADHTPEWVDPLTADVADVRVHELPPNSQGVAALQALLLLGHTDIAHHDPDSAQALHLQVEAVKLALADAHATVADPQAMTTATSDLVAEQYIADRAAQIDPQRAGTPGDTMPKAGGTVVVCASDPEGRAIALLQSNYMGFGSGIVVPGTGISLQNRAAGFVTDPHHPNAVAACKRPFHTIIPALVTRGDALHMVFGLMGGQMQAQGHVQMTLRTALWGMNPQGAADAPRWRVGGGRRLLLEQGFDASVAEQLRSLGHEVAPAPPTAFGGAQAIMRRDGGWLGASDWRKEGLAAAR